MNEAEKIRAQYDRRKTLASADLYNPLKPANVFVRQEKERAICRFIGRWLDGRSLSELSIMEIGCGSGTNLLQMIGLGATPAKIIANELLEERLAATKINLPHSVKILEGDASKLNIPKNSLDIVVQSTVFSSILNKNFAQDLAQEIFSWVKPGGAILWYDFVYNNPNNKDVRGISLTEIQTLFPNSKLHFKRVTLAPPIARRLGFTTPILYPILNILPFLRTHMVCMIYKNSL
jgi:SAM-dependent methyltransferase